MRKNVTQKEWCKIYRHCRPRLEDSTRTRGDLKLKRTRKKTEVIVRNRTYTWDKAWKNMKNAGAIAQLLSPDGQLVEYTSVQLFLALTWYRYRTSQPTSSPYRDPHTNGDTVIVAITAPNRSTLP